MFHLAQHDVVQFGVLRRAVFCITEKMLIQNLKELERDGIVKRKVYRQVPPKVEYSLTDLGKSFIPILNSMFEWGTSYASYLVTKAEESGENQPGVVLENLDELLKPTSRHS